MLGNSRLQKPYIRMILLLGLLLLWQAPTAAETPDGVVYTGHYRLKTQMQSIIGSTQQFKLDTGLEPGNFFAQNLALSGFGSLQGGWYLNGRYDDNLPTAERFELRINKAANEIYAGTRRFSLASPGLLQWGRMITGIQTTLVTPGPGTFGLRAATGAPLGIPVRVELTGKGLVGPYLLPAQYLPVIVGSESVYIDGLIQRRDDDYEIDAELGGVTFRTPVAQTSEIVVEYEYQAPQPRRINVATGRWKEERFVFDVLTAQEHAIILPDDNPLVFIPPDGEAEFPTRQQMEGAALAYRLTPSFTLTGSWLNTRNTIGEEQQQAAAWQTGGEWQGERFRGGWDYRVAAPGFRPIGRSASDSGYQTLSAGYEYKFADPWHSKFNAVWQAGSGPDQAEHVLTYAHDQSMAGWSLSITSNAETSAQLSTGFLGVTKLGPWNLEAERRGVVARYGVPVAGDTLSLTRLAANLDDYATATGSMQWKQDIRINNNGGQDTASVWRLMLASKASANPSTVLFDTERLSWRLQWQQSNVDTIQPSNSNQSQPVSRFSYGRGEVGVPLGNSRFSGNLLSEFRQRTALGDTSAEAYARAGLRYSNQSQWDLYAGVLRADLGAQQPGRQQISSGLETRIPLSQRWVYRGSLQAFEETGSDGRSTGWQSVQGLTWNYFGWSVGADYTNGLLAQPTQPGDTKEDRPPLSQLPVGHRLGLQVERRTDTAQVTTQLARDIEPSAQTWRAKFQVAAKVGVSQLSADYNGAWRQGTIGWQQQESGKVAMQWWISPQTYLGISGRVDIRQSVGGSGDYHGNGIYTELTTRF